MKNKKLDLILFYIYIYLYMKEVYKAYKVKIYPTKTQKELLEKHFGCNRFVYNYFLDVRRIYYNYFKKSLSFIDTTKLLTKLKKKDKYSFLKEVSAQSLNYSLYNLNESYQNFFKKKSKYPKKKKKRGKKEENNHGMTEEELIAEQQRLFASARMCDYEEDE